MWPGTFAALAAALSFIHQIPWLVEMVENLHLLHRLCPTFGLFTNGPNFFKQKLGTYFMGVLQWQACLEFASFGIAANSFCLLSLHFGSITFMLGQRWSGIPCTCWSCFGQS